MTYEEAKILATTLYWTASSQHDVDDQQWRMLFNVFNKKYWNDIATGTGSLFAKDSAVLISDSAGMYDFSGSLYNLSDLTPAQITNLSTIGGWTLTNVTTATGFYAPDNSNTAWQLTDTVTNGVHAISLANAPTWANGTGTDCIYAKAGTNQFVWLSDTGSPASAVWFNLATGTVGTVAGSSVTGVITPVPAPSFSTQMGTTSGASPTTSMNGWYKCKLVPTSTTRFNQIYAGMSPTDGTSSYAGGTGTVFLWGPRKAYQDNMVDANGVHVPLAVELKFLGRYIHLDYEIPQDRYIYNIAFGQVQVLIPTAWTLMGEKIVMLPRTSGLQTFRMTFIPRVSELILDTQTFLNGYLPQFHQLIVYEAVASMLRTGSDTRPVLGPLTEMRSQWKSFLQSRQRQEGRKIRFVPYE